MATSWVHLFFHWPDGGVWTNLVASAIWALPAGFLAARKLRKMHRHILMLHEHLGIEPTGKRR